MSDPAMLRRVESALASLACAIMTPAEDALRRRLETFAARLRAGRLQLAVVGQFKRGKSTLLNALLGSPVLPTGAIPLTAIPTFIAYGSAARLHAEFFAQNAADFAPSDTEISSLLAELATEKGNPHNVKGVERIELALPADILVDGLVLIDTPGIGSAELHNSETAVAALPECDAALFILSPDPPITEAELGYLAAVQRQAALIVPVLTKTDTIGAEDLETLERYLRSVLARVGVAEPIISVSARSRIGLDRLYARIQAITGDTRRLLLERAIIRKAVETLDDLAFQNEASLAALRLPIGQLDSKTAAFRRAAQAIGRENEAALDVTSGDRRRLLEIIDQEARKVAAEAHATLSADFADADVADRNALFAALSNRSTTLFEIAYRACATLVDARLSEIADRARERVNTILAEIREAAAETLGIAFRAPDAAIEIDAPKTLAWVERQQESMNPLPPGFLSGFLPRAARREAQRKWLAREIDRLTIRNTENLRWTLHQQTVEILRRFDGVLRDQLAGAEMGMIELMTRARAVRARSVEEGQSEIETRQQTAQALDGHIAELRVAAARIEGVKT